MLRIVALCGGLAGAAGLSQYPAFSEAYLQRLAGQVDALTQVVQDFDTSALEAGLGREAALQQMTGSDFLIARQRDMRATFARHARLSDNLIALREATQLQRMTMPQRLTDAETFAATWSDFQPALPLSAAGAVSASAGFLAGWAGFSTIMALLARPFRRRRRAAVTRAEPIVARPQPRLVADQPAPKLGGVRR